MAMKHLVIELILLEHLQIMKLVRFALKILPQPLTKLVFGLMEAVKFMILLVTLF